MNLSIPLRVTPNIGLKQETSIRTSIDSFLNLLLVSPTHSCIPDHEFGFIFTNLKFELLNEYDGTVSFDWDKKDIQESEQSLYSKKVSGNSKNINTFASYLKSTIEKYEKRLSNIEVTMIYIREEKIIYISVNGIIVESNESYQYKTTLDIWS